jgi:hypothetical protein
MRDNLPTKPWINETGILNLDISANEGTHWVCWCKKNRVVKFFDSHGLSPPKAFVRYMRGVKKLLYNVRQEQPHGSVICGHLSLRFLAENRCSLAK